MRLALAGGDDDLQEPVGGRVGARVLSLWVWAACPRGLFAGLFFLVIRGWFALVLGVLLFQVLVLGGFVFCVQLLSPG